MLILGMHTNGGITTGRQGATGATGPQGFGLQGSCMAQPPPWWASAERSLRVVRLGTVMREVRTGLSQPVATQAGRGASSAFTLLAKQMRDGGNRIRRYSRSG